jgi:ADP-heptose:LPS heptosyltransferase
MSLPALQQLSSHYPEGSISVLARSSVAGIYERETWASEVIPLTAGRGRGDSSTPIDTRQKSSHNLSDVGIDLNHVWSL